MIVLPAHWESRYQRALDLHAVWNIEHHAGTTQAERRHRTRCRLHQRQGATSAVPSRLPCPACRRPVGSRTGRLVS
jgi:hypothetical protein